MKNDNRINLALSPRVMLGLLNSKVIIVSHGMFFLNIFRKFSTAKIVNVWHGLPNQLIDEEIFNQFDENWIYSDFQKALFKNPLDGIVGIGANRKKSLLEEFGSAKAVGSASLEDLLKVDGINKSIAKNIFNFFN